MTLSSIVPEEVDAVFRHFLTCELSTCSMDGTPVTWPIEPYYQAEQGQFLVTTSIGLAQKAFNIRRNPNVSLLFSNSTGSGLSDPPAVLVQGVASASDEIYADFEGELREFANVAFQRQPAAQLYSGNPLTRYLFDWYYMRLTIHVVPRRILWWDHADFSLKPDEMEVCYVG
jgi:Pyridoxamine 5'-phosphate oxidase